PDTVVVNGTSGNDHILITGDSTAVKVSGLAARVNITGAEAHTDHLRVNALAGADVVDASGLTADAIPLTVEGGPRSDTISGGAGNDLIEGGRGNDVMFGGAGDDVFTWDPGDGSDVIEGQGGHDTMQFTGANVDEHIDISANGRRVRFFRDIGKVTMDLNGVE